jgi:4-hydroxy-3-polyprenylbenzoate decarboxylase
LKRIVAAVTGASGAAYGLAFARRAVELGAQVDWIVSAAGQRVAQDELGFPLDPASPRCLEALGSAAARIRKVPVSDIGAEAASGSIPFAGMAILPCSMGTVGRIANGVASNLIERAADVMLKERRTLVIAPRETPLNRIHLKNLLALDEAGAVILPAMPAFYARPRTIEDLVDTVVDRALAFFFGAEVVRSKWRPESDRKGTP